MKKFYLLLALTLVTCTGVFAQAKKALMTVTIKTPSVQCDMCKDRIEKFLAKEEGVQKATVDYKRKTTKVSFYTDRTNIENIKTAIANLGYDADDVSANDESYQKLPRCCKKPEDSKL
ncbi:MAG: heavy-metal-associated domain-containing protein [Bacteroidetes bacterium]|nr:heavy-metal-associated domain-containing protein [Bacteroidota bacterium]